MKAIAANFPVQSTPFFGREEEVGAFLERLRVTPVLPVVGPSGAGKSSFVQAGVLPRLRDRGQWVVLQMRPGLTPLRSIIAPGDWKKRRKPLSSPRPI